MGFRTAEIINIELNHQSSQRFAKIVLLDCSTGVLTEWYNCVHNRHAFTRVMDRDGVDYSMEGLTLAVTQGDKALTLTSEYWLPVNTPPDIDPKASQSLVDYFWPSR